MSEPAAVVGTRYATEAITAQTVYILYLVGLVFPLLPAVVLNLAFALTPAVGWLTMAYALTPIIGLIMAYLDREDAPAWVQTHYKMQSRTLWLGLLYGLVTAAATAVVFVGWIVGLFTLIWWIMRSVKGLKTIAAGMPYDAPEHYIW